ncbi:uncharacterized protein TNCV_2304451 [Trichonephila clavipes]|nr:uncharacterized protein TNCV_2304451 [Trichonephila clavipes]
MLRISGSFSAENCVKEVETKLKELGIITEKNLVVYVTDVASMMVKLGKIMVATVAEWSRYRIVAGLVTSSSPVLLKTCGVGERSMLNLSRARMASRWCYVVVRRGGASSGVVHVT